MLIRLVADKTTTLRLFYAIIYFLYELVIILNVNINNHLMVVTKKHRVKGFLGELLLKHPESTQLIFKVYSTIILYF